MAIEEYRHEEAGTFCHHCGIRLGTGHLLGCPVGLNETREKARISEVEIRIQSLITVPWKNTSLIFALAADGCLYRQVKRGWIAVSMKIVQPDPVEEF